MFIMQECIEMYDDKNGRRFTARKNAHLRGRFSTLKRIMLLDGLLLAIVPGLVVASVVIGFVYPMSTSAIPSPFRLQQGPGYSIASSLGLTSAIEDSNGNVASGTTINVNSTAHSSDVYLLNVLQIYNASTKWPAGAVASVYINGTLPAGVEMYYSTSPMTFDGTSVSGTLWTTGAHIALPASSGNVELYFSFVVAGGSTGTGQLTFQYNV